VTTDDDDDNNMMMMVVVIIIIIIMAPSLHHTGQYGNMSTLSLCSFRATI
jgi:hypothetical protein